MDKANKMIGFIGAGAMGEAMIKGFINSGRVAPGDIVAAEPREAQRNNLREKYGIQVVIENSKVIERCELVFLAVKPQVIAGVLTEISRGLQKKHVLLSIAAGISLQFLEDNCPPGTSVWRIMPNTPALAGEGMIAYCGGRWVTAEQEEIIHPLLASLGTAIKLPENYMNAVTGLSGSGPAYILYFLEAMIDGGVKAGLPRDISSELALQTLYGTAYMLKEEKTHPALLKEKVTSPGGTTIYGLHVLEKGAVAGWIMEAVVEAARRARELEK